MSKIISDYNNYFTSVTNSNPVQKKTVVFREQTNSCVNLSLKCYVKILKPIQIRLSLTVNIIILFNFSGKQRYGFLKGVSLFIYK